MNKQRLIVGISGASGVIYGIRLLQVLRDMPEIETHLVMTKAAKLTAEYEVDMSAKEIEALADVVHNNTNVGASISSGTFKTMGMAVIPCSIKSLSGIANAFHENLLIRAADVVLKERRRLVVVPRETPLTRTHLELMIRLIDSGGIMVPSHAGVLHPSQNRGRHRQSHRRQSAGPVRHRTRSIRALERKTHQPINPFSPFPQCGKPVSIP